MDAEKDIKFDFFNSKKKPIVTLHNKLAVGLMWTPFILGVLISSFNNPRAASQSQQAVTQNAGYVSLIKAMDEQEALIDAVQVLDLSDVGTTINAIQKLGFSIKNMGFKDGSRVYAVGYKSLGGSISYAILSSNKNEKKLFWKDVGTSSILLAAQWDHDTYPIQIVDNANQTDVELKITHNDIKETQKIKELEEKVTALQQENDKIKKEYAENVIKKTIKENPSLQEQELTKYINLIMNSKK